MHKHIDSFKEEISKLVLKDLYAAYKADIRTQHVRFEAIHKQVAETLDSGKSPADTAEALHGLLEYELYEDEGQTLEAFADSFYTGAEQALNDLPATVSIVQHTDRFTILKTDGKRTKLYKRIKKIGFGITDLPRRTANIFRKKKKKKVYWKHVVPLRAIAKKHLLADFIQSVSTIRGLYLKDFSYAYVQLLIQSVDQQKELYESQALQTAFTKSRNSLRKRLTEQLEINLNDLAVKAELVDTLELNAKNYRESKVAEAIDLANANWKAEDKHWNNSFLLLFEEWQSDLELKQLTEQAKESLNTYHASQSRTFEKSICPELDTILDFITETKSELDSTSELSQSLKKCNYRAQKSLDETTIPKLLNILTSKNTINAVARLENAITQELKSLTFDLRLSKVATQYQEAIPTTNIATISLSDLITFEIAPSLFGELDQIKGKLMTELNKQITLTGDLDHMITFGLSTAIQQLQDTDEETAQRVAMETLQRAEERVLEVKEALDALFNQTHEALGKATADFNKKLEALMENENIREMRLRIAKAKTIQQTKAYRQEVRARITAYFEQTKTQVLNRYKETSDALQTFRQRFILTSRKTTASRAVSDFLSSSQERINSLPIIYKNLYKIEPLTDLELFVGRSKEIEQINEAYTNWSTGYMGSAVLYGEKWSGMTSLLNFLQTSGSLKHPMTRIKCKTSLDSKGQFDQILKNIVNTEEAVTVDQVQEKLITGSKRIVILEDIQNLYLRKTGGFNVIKSLLTLISNTSNHVFWMTSCTVYTWEYFKKTLHIHEIFSYHIGLQKPNEEDLSSIIQKRNRISGYKIVFETDEDTRSSKRFTKMSENDQQEFLKKRFFKNLIDFSESNISMALMFWLLSTKSVDQNRIVINSFEKPDLSFLEIMSMDKILALHALILHDGLSLEQFAEVMRRKPQAAFLQLSMMLEDGILVKKDGQFLVNTLVYRSVISLLKSKNLIYA